MSKPSRRPTREARELLKTKITKAQNEIRNDLNILCDPIEHRTQATNAKFPAKSIDEQRLIYEDITSAQISAWRSMLPGLIKQFSKIKDVRRQDSIKHKVTTLMIYGLFIFIFRLSSRRKANKELSAPFVSEKIKEIFPEFESIPHADTLARFLENTNPLDIEKINIDLVKELILNKKFKTLLIQGCLPISIDATQKLVREGLLHDSKWLERSFQNNDQQYIMVVEANITFKNGLTIPLMTEYLYNDTDVLADGSDAQDCELEGSNRLIVRIKNSFKRLKIIIILDNLYANMNTIQLLLSNKFQFMIKLPSKIKTLKKELNSQRNFYQKIEKQLYYRERKQVFCWKNNIKYGDKSDVIIHVVSCRDKWFEVDKNTGEIVVMVSEHCWISSIEISIDNVNELCNLCGRKRALIEDSMNTEKNRGYFYENAYSYNWNGMRCFHQLMRLAHAINAISEFTKTLKKYIKSLGVLCTLNIIFEALSNPWLSDDWMKIQLKKDARLYLNL